MSWLVLVFSLEKNMQNILAWSYDQVSKSINSAISYAWERMNLDFKSKQANFLAEQAEHKDCYIFI